MIQTLAIFKDAYRELNSKRLFWIVMAISVAVVASFALLGNNERGMTVVGYTLEIPFLSTRAVSPAGFYKFIFSNVGVNFWLTWGAAILALVSTAGMIPDFVSSGSIDMSLCKPIGRVRLFLTKYAAGLLFVGLQVVIFSIGALLVIGIRGKSWEPSVFLAVPIVVAFYSFLYCICALIGLVTRSGITALLLTLLIWLLIWAFSTAEVQLLRFSLDAKRTMEQDRTHMAAVRPYLEELKQQLELARANVPQSGHATSTAEPSSAAATPPQSSVTIPAPVADGGAAKNNEPPRRGRARREWERMGEIAGKMAKLMQPTSDPDELQRRVDEAQSQLDEFQKRFSESETSYRSLSRWQKGLYVAKTVLPKTGETADLLKRYVIDKKDREGILQLIEEQTGDSTPKDVQNALDARSIGWVAGTSVAFEFVVLAIACVYFSRKDF